MHFGYSPCLHFLVLLKVCISGVCLVLRAVTHNATPTQSKEHYLLVLHANLFRWSPVSTLLKYVIYILA